VALAKALSRHRRRIVKKTSSFMEGILNWFPICRAKILYFPDAGRNENRAPEHRWISQQHHTRQSLCKRWCSKSGRRWGKGWSFYIFSTWLIVNSDIDRLHLHIFAGIEVPERTLRGGKCEQNRKEKEEGRKETEWTWQMWRSGENFIFPE